MRSIPQPHAQWISSLQRTNPSRPAFLNLDTLLRQTIDISGFDGVVGVYVLDLKTGEEIDFAYNQGGRVQIPPDIAFSASSTIENFGHDLHLSRGKPKLRCGDGR